jgi:3-oxoacyl-[acyl-carrier protein] reductase
MMEVSLKGRTALVCGSTKGIGWAIAQAFARQGATCILFARNKEKLQEQIALLDHSAGQQHAFAVADFADTQSLEVEAARLAKQYTIDILVNNTGGPKAGMANEAAATDFEAAFRQHLMANHLLATALIPGMKKRKFGRIINIISTSVRIPIDNLGVSNTIRAAVASWSKTMANELGAYGITVNSILPGFIDTQRLRSLISSNASRKQLPEEQVEQAMIATIPAGRFGTPEEIANVATFLAAPAASYVNGISIPVDGGKTGTI